MQVSLDTVDWSQLTAFSDATAFLDWYFDLEDESELGGESCYKNGWESDSAIQYFEVAGMLANLAAIASPPYSEHLTQGLLRLISEAGHVDEFEMSEPSEGCYWISACPATTREIKHHVDAIDIEECFRLLTEHPTAGVQFGPDQRDMFASVVRQHIKMVDLAVDKDHGLLGHCG